MTASRLSPPCPANIDIASSHDWGREFRPTLQTIRRKYNYNHAHNATTVAAMLKELRPAPARRTHSSTMPGSNRHRQRRLQSSLPAHPTPPTTTRASDTEHTEAASAVQTDSRLLHQTQQCHRGPVDVNERNNRRGGRRCGQRGTAAATLASAQPLPALQEICTPQAAPQNSRRPLFLEQAIQGIPWEVDLRRDGNRACAQAQICCRHGPTTHFNHTQQATLLPSTQTTPTNTHTQQLQTQSPTQSSERQARRLRLLNEATLLDRHISWAEDENHQGQSRHHIQATTSYRHGPHDASQETTPTLSRTGDGNNDTPRLEQPIHYQTCPPPPTNPHFDSKATTPPSPLIPRRQPLPIQTDRLAAGLPILRASTRRVGAANGSTSTATYASQLPFPQLSPNAVRADSFADFPQSLMSVGEPLLIGARGRTRSLPHPTHPTQRTVATTAPLQEGTTNTPTRQQRDTTSHPPNKPSDGCMQCVDTPSSPPGSRPSKPAISSDGHCSPPATCRNTSQRQWKLQKGTSTNAARTPGLPNRNRFPSKPSSLPNSSAANYATCTHTSTIHATPSSQTKQDNSLTALPQATITSWRCSPQTHVLDNEISTAMKTLITDTYKMTYLISATGCHRRNAAEVAIRNFKSHFLSILAGVADDFPMKLWDKLLPQAEITINLLRQSNATPTVSATRI
eukprot:CCRYP_019164-RA/>CCRYP_019164-RA protein AED:0.63 eAED:0.31 QI:0/0/0/0.75/1/1/4/0/681